MIGRPVSHCWRSPQRAYLGVLVFVTATMPRAVIANDSTTELRFFWVEEIGAYLAPAANSPDLSEDLGGDDF